MKAARIGLWACWVLEVLLSLVGLVALIWSPDANTGACFVIDLFMLGFVTFLVREFAGGFGGQRSRY